MKPGKIEAGCDEAGRGCLAGPVYAAAVILPQDYSNSRINDSKKLSAMQRAELVVEIQRDAVSWAVASCSPAEIDRLNILWASVEAMHRALAKLENQPNHILVDGKPL